MSLTEIIKRVYHIFVRELVIMWRHPIYGFCTIVFPVLVMAFFTTLMNEGEPVEMPVGVVDQDNTHVSRAMIRQLDAFQTTHVEGHYANMNDARDAIRFLAHAQGHDRRAAQLGATQDIVLLQ